MSVQDAKGAIDRAAQAFVSWKKTSEYERSSLLTKMYQSVIEFALTFVSPELISFYYRIMTDNTEDLAQIITMENGKSITEARGEVAYGGKQRPVTFREEPKLICVTVCWVFSELFAVRGLARLDVGADSIAPIDGLLARLCAITEM